MKEAHDHARVSDEGRALDQQMARIDETERILLRQVAMLQADHHRAMLPVMRALGNLRALRPPAPIIMHVSDVDPAVLECLGRFPGDPKAERFDDRMHRLETDRRELMALLRMLAAGGARMEPETRQLIEMTVDSMKP